MPGEPDQLYIEARRALLDALEALKPHLDSLIVVGAQAIYLHAGEADVAVATYTKDGDVAIDPRNLGAIPHSTRRCWTLDSLRASSQAFGTAPGPWLRSISLCPTVSAEKVDIAALASLGTGRVPCDAWSGWRRHSWTTLCRASEPLSHRITERSRCESPAQERSS